MLNKIPIEAGAFFLSEFTKKLIDNSKNEETITVLKSLREKIKENIQQKEGRERLHENLKKRKIQKSFRFSPSNKVKRMPVSTRVMIPRQRLPPTVSSIRPVPTDVFIDLGKLNPLIKDPMVKVIESNGADKNVFVRLKNGVVKPARIKLTKEDINSIIDEFSALSKIPVQEGFFRAATGRLIISATISDLAESKFVISKMI